MKNSRVIQELIYHALQAVDSEQAVARSLTCDGYKLSIGQQVYALSQIDRIFVVGAGKAAANMAYAAENILGEYLTSGLVITRKGQANDHQLKRISILEAGHPLPDKSGLTATKQLLDFLNQLTERDLVICLISGGSSSLLTLPWQGVEVADLIELNRHLLASGMPIQEMNVIRKHLSQITGGRLATWAMPASVVSLIISDVIGNAIDSIGSGPTAPDPSTYATALAILDNYNLSSQAPASIIRVLQDGNVGHLPETPKPGDPLFYRVANHIIASNRQAVEAVAQHAQDIGFHTQVLSTSMEGEAREVGQFLASVLREMAQNNRPLPRPGCCIVSGETTVTLKKNHGQGGRNQELALAAALGLTGLNNVVLVALATDGIDGPTDAAGAIVDETTVARGRLAGFEAKKHLLENNAYPFLAATGDLLRLGPTGTNVNDLILLLSF